VHEGTDDHTERVANLRALLRRFPYWLEGHRRLATAALDADDIGTAYAAAICMTKLAAPGSAAADEATFILGKSFLKRDDPERALAYFQKLSGTKLPAASVSEETAAALMALGRSDEALTRLMSIPEAERSPEARTVLSYLQSKSSPQSH